MGVQVCHLLCCVPQVIHRGSLMGRVVRFVAAAERAEAVEAARVLSGLAALPGVDVPGSLRASLQELVSRGRSEPGSDEWPGRGFSMLGRQQFGDVWDEIMALPSRDRPVKVRDLLVLVMLNLSWCDREVLLPRDRIALKLRVSPGSVSRLMGVLERLGVVERRRDGRRVRYFMNAEVGWRGPLPARRDALAEQPALRLVGGGSVSDDRSS